MFRLRKVFWLGWLGWILLGSQSLSADPFAQSEETKSLSNRIEWIFTISVPVLGALWILTSFYRKKRERARLELGEDWLPHRQTPLVFRFSDMSLNRVRLGESFEALKPLGKPDNLSPVYYSSFNYHASGLQVYLLEQQIVHFAVYFQTAGSEFQAAKLRLIGENGEWQLDAATRLEELKKFLPSSFKEVNYEDGSAELSCSFGMDLLNIEFDEKQRLLEFGILRAETDEKPPT